MMMFEVQTLNLKAPKKFVTQTAHLHSWSLRRQRTYQSERDEKPDQHHHRQTAADYDEDQTVLSNEQLQSGLTAFAVASMRITGIRRILAGYPAIDRNRIHPGLRLILVLQHAAGDRNIHGSAVIASTPFRIGVVGITMNSTAFVLIVREGERVKLDKL